MCGLAMMVVKYCFRSNWTFFYSNFDDIADIGAKLLINELVI